MYYRIFIFADFSSNDVVFKELTVGLTAANGYLSNYNAWNHCFWVIQKSLEYGNFVLIAQHVRKLLKFGVVNMYLIIVVCNTDNGYLKV